TAPAALPGRLTARVRPATSEVADIGERRLGFGASRDGTLYVPRQIRAAYPLLLLLHGAHGAGERIAHRLRDLADDFGFIIVAPDSREETWDATRGRLGPDVLFIDRALRDVFRRYPVDAGRVAISGFSDGASYALTLGVMNGDLFTHI